MSHDRAEPPRDVGVAGALALVGDYVEGMVLHTVRDVHGAVAGRWFGLANRVTRGAARVPQEVHDDIAAAVYRGIGVGIQTVATGIRVAEQRGIGPRLEDRAGGRQLLSFVNGLFGDRLVEERPELAIPLAVRLRGSDVPVDPANLAAAYPRATEDVVVFLHGLAENDDSWDRQHEENGGSYGSKLAAETSWTPVLLRANTGLPIGENGAAVAALLDDLVAAWPVPVRRVALVGHSMGGLILRAACAVSTEADSPWTSLVTNVVTLGSPHLGAPLERTVDVGARVLRVLPEAAPFGRILEHRSVGILNLRAGLAPDIQHLPHARYHLVAATLAASPGHPVSELLGDLFVRYPSAVGRPRRGREMFPGADVLHVPRTDHFGLLNHPDVYDALKSWLG